MKQLFHEKTCIIYFEHRNNVTSVIDLHREYSPLASILKLDYECDIISTFKTNYTIAIHRITLKYQVMPGNLPDPNTGSANNQEN